MADAGHADLSVTTSGSVAHVILRRPPDNHFDLELIQALAAAFERIDADTSLSAIVLSAEGKCFCAGARFTGAEGQAALEPGTLYHEALRLFACRKPVVAAIQGPAIGGGLGLALMADFRVASPLARFGANFVKIGISPGFGLTHTLPRLVGDQQAALLLLTGRRLDADQAKAIGMIDQLVPADDLDRAALALATEIAENAPLALAATRALLRDGLVERLRRQVEREAAEQRVLFATDDFREGARAVAERRPGTWTGR